MGATVSPRERLSGNDLRRGLASFVRRRVPAAEVEDIAQTVLCDALASPRMPEDPEAVRRFVAGIARHKVVDFHRRERRFARDAEVPEPSCDAPPVEDRALLVRVVESATRSPRERETFDWLLREHDGERLADIAAEAGVAPATVRQRVSRLRRALRARWSHALLVLLVGGSCGALATRALDRPASSIVAEPTGDDAARMLGLSSGDWRVEAVTVDPRASIAQRSAFALEARASRVCVAGGRVEIRTPTRELARTVALTPRGDGSFDVVLGGGARVERGTARLDRGALLVTIDGYSARLVRE